MSTHVEDFKYSVVWRRLHVCLSVMVPTLEILLQAYNKVVLPLNIQCVECMILALPGTHKQPLWGTVLGRLVFVDKLPLAVALDGHASMRRVCALLFSANPTFLVWLEHLLQLSLYEKFNTLLINVYKKLQFIHTSCLELTKSTFSSRFNSAGYHKLAKNRHTLASPVHDVFRFLSIPSIFKLVVTNFWPYFGSFSTMGCHIYFDRAITKRIF